MDHAREVARSEMLARFAVVRTRGQLEAIAAGEYVGEDGARARRNRDAPGSCTLSGGAAVLRMPKQDCLSILERHVPWSHAELLRMGEVSDRGSVVITARDPQAMNDLAEWLIDAAVEVYRSPAAPIRGRDTSHDTQQILLRSSQARVLADELDAR